MPFPYPHKVTPGAGVWIEITSFFAVAIIHIVTPGAGVWIEISSRALFSSPRLSLPVRECGLKLSYAWGVWVTAYVTPGAGVWIEIYP